MGWELISNKWREVAEIPNECHRTGIVGDRRHGGKGNRPAGWRICRDMRDDAERIRPLRHGDGAGGEQGVFRAVPRGIGERVIAGEAWIGEVSQIAAVHAQRTVGRLRDNPQRGDCRSDGDGQVQRHVVGRAAGDGVHRRGGIGVDVVIARAIVTGVAANERAAEEVERDRAAIEAGGQRARPLHAGQHCAAEVSSVAGLTSSDPAGQRADQIGMRGDPALADGMHPVRSGSGVRGARVHRDMAGGAFRHHTDVTLDPKVADVVVDVCAGKFRVGRTVAGFALQPAMTGGKAEEPKACGRNVGLRGESPIRRHADGVICVREDRGVTDLAVVACRGAGMAARAIRFHEPADTIGRADDAHAAVATLALHFHRAVGGHRAAHRTAQAAGG